MSPEKQRLLRERHPAILTTSPRDGQDNPSVCGIECDDGWYDLIDTLCRNIQQHVQSNQTPQVTALQIKEKFGQLRFYVSNSNPEIYAMIKITEALSARICEYTGCPGHLHVRNGYYKTLSPQLARSLGFAEPAQHVAAE